MSGARPEDAMAGHRVAVVGATGAAGEMTLRILEERKFPVRDLRAFASERSVGKTVTFAGEPIRVEKVTAGGVPGRRDRLLLRRNRPVEGARPAGGPRGSRGRGQVERVPDGSGGPARRARDQRPRHPGAPGHRGEPELHDRGHGHGAGAAPPRRARDPCRGDQLPGGLGRRGAGRRGAPAADPRVGARRGDRPGLLPAPDRLQRDPPHRQVRSGRVHGRGAGSS